MDEIDRVEFLQTMRNMSQLARAAWDEFLEQGFTEDQAMELTKTWLNATIRSANGGDGE